MPMAEVDRTFMTEAIALGATHLGRTWPNPSVGALVVAPDADGGTIIGRGVTAAGGRPHAEPQALAQAGDKARGATLYVTLEPCAHQGKAPPCTEAIIAAGIKRVVVACDDPNPKVAGQGYAALRAAGIEVVTGVGAEAAWTGLRAHITRVKHGRPFVQVKMAVSPDGFIGSATRAQVRVTGAEARQWTHEARAASDAILVGAETARLDDPDLTVRILGQEHRSPVRIVADRLAGLPVTSRLATTATKVPVWLLVGAEASGDRRTALAALGVRIIEVATSGGHLDPAVMLTALAGEGLGSVLVEGGGRQVGAFLASGLVGEVALMRGAAMLGSGHVPAPEAILGLDRAPGWRHVSTAALGADQIDIYDAI